MTVRELIAELQKQDQDATVVYPQLESRYWESMDAVVPTQVLRAGSILGEYEVSNAGDIKAVGLVHKQWWDIEQEYNRRLL